MLTRKSKLSAPGLAGRGHWMSSAPGVLESNAVSARGAGAATVARFSGPLDGLSVADLLQILQLVSKSACITVTVHGSDSQVWCTDGAIIDAQSGALQGEAALFQILGFEQGWLVAELKASARTRTIFASSQHLLLEAARRQDEAQLSGRTQLDTRSGEHEIEPPETTRAKPESLVPLVAQVRATPSTPAAKARRNAPWLALTALLLVPGGYLWGAHTARVFERVGAAPAAAPVQPVMAGTEPEPPERYALDVQVEPAIAQLSLDGRSIAFGTLHTSAARDGKAHELRVLAPGFVPLTILFTDTAPPSHVQLEPLPAPAPPPAEAAPGSAAAPAHGVVPPVRSAGRSRSPSGSGPRGNEPRVQVIGEEPTVRILD